MALSTKAKKECIRDARREDPATMDAEPLTRTQIIALLTGLDDWYESNRASAKTAMQNEAGITITNATAKMVAKYWMRKKWGFE